MKNQTRFSDRLGVTQPVFSLELGSMSNELQNSLWNLLFNLYEYPEHGYWNDVARFVAEYVRKVPVDDLPSYSFECCDWLKEYFFGLNWYETYNLLESILENHKKMADHKTLQDFAHPIPANDVETWINETLEREHSGYRFIAHVLSPISDPIELDTVRAATQLHGFGLDGARQHIHAALELFSKRPSPDFRNAVKEAISAIESIATQVCAGRSSGLTAALRALEEKAGLHGALRSAFEKLYGYTCDEEGIRHAMLQNSSVGFEEAKYMIVACSAGANYLAAKAEKAGLLR